MSSHMLQSTIKAITECAPLGDGIELITVTDINEAQSAGEVRRAFRTALFHAGLKTFRTSPEHCAIGAFNTHQAAMETQKAAFPIECLRGRPTVVLVNVAEIAEAEGGRRKDHVWVGVAPHNRLLIGYVAPGSPLLSRTLPGLKGLWEFETPEPWDRNKHFRTRDVLPRVAAGILANDAHVMELLRPLGSSKAAERFGISGYDPTRAWWPDEIGRGPFNIKTGWDTRDPLVQALRPGDRLRACFSARDPLVATFAHSLQSSGKRNEWVFCHASSGYDMGPEHGGEIHFCDLMLYSGRAFKHAGQPEEDEKLTIESLGA